ncbi:hypothetical protein K439DRAFT_1412828 [Ramaria rubella]|nr:hypothetical protein K439DRAFT_1412828 [Ramaria rubella]
MLRARISQGLKSTIMALPSASTSSSFHTSLTMQETRRTRIARAAKKDNTEKRAERARIAERTKPDPVLGHSPGDDAKWLNCDLAKVLVSQTELQSPTAHVTPLDTTQPLQLPETFQWGIAGDPQAQHLLFDSVPHVSSQHGFQNMDVVNVRDPHIQRRVYQAQWREMHNAHMLTRLVDLRNASASGIAFENRRRCVEEFSTPEKPNDTGRPEVQAALMTMKIRKLWAHLQRNRKDISNIRSLRKLVHQRAKMLKYLKRLDRDRYETVLGRLGIEEGAIEGELIV